MHLPSPIYTEANKDKVFEKLTSSDNELQLIFETYLSEYEKPEDRIDYIDISEVSRYIVRKVKEGQTQSFPAIFEDMETILESCDNYIENLIVIGLFEGIQNIGGNEINYHSGFDQWLGSLSKAKWDALIDSWEGSEWRVGHKTKIHGTQAGKSKN